MKKLKTTLKQLEILNLLYRYRFLNRHQIQKFLNHKDPKRINTWLKDLHQNKIIGRHYSTKIGENTRPAIYYLSAKSKQVLSNINNPDITYTNLGRVYREHIRSRLFVERCIFIADLYFYLSDSLKPDQKLSFFTKVELENFNYLPKPLPESYIAILDPKLNKRYFLEIFDENTPRFVARSRVERYCEYKSLRLWERNSDQDFPAVLMVFSDQKLKDYMMTFIPRYFEEEYIDDISFFLTTKALIEQTKLSVNVWDMPE